MTLSNLALLHLLNSKEIRRLLALLIILTGVTLTGITQVYFPFLGPTVIIAVILLPLLVVADAWVLVALIVALPLYSRLLVALGAPALLTYAHFALAFVIIWRLLLASGSSQLNSLIRRDIFIFLGLAGLFLLLVLLSALQGGWHALRPIIFFLNLIEPFAVLALILTSSESIRYRLRWVIIVLASTQLPFVFFQLMRFGPGDRVQGTLVRQGAGAHVIAGACIVGALLCFAPRKSVEQKLGMVVLGAALISVAIAGDAKQVYAALIAAGLAVMPRLMNNGTPWFLGMAFVFTSIFMLGSQIYDPLNRMVDRALVEDYLSEKASYVNQVLDQFDVGQHLLGAGPGNGTSRTALLTLPGYGNVPGALIGNSAAPLILQLVGQYREKWPANSGSSANSPFSSWLSIFSDLGLLGLLTYLALAAWAWRTLRFSHPVERTLGEFLLISLEFSDWFIHGRKSQSLCSS